jgi:signal transduction histidine kinase/DNA-binding CsgD family transcriptional regulator
MEKTSLTSPMVIREEERRRLARLLEEGLGQSLNLLLAQANAYHAALAPPSTQTRQAIHTLTTMAGQALTTLQDLVADLNPGDLQDLGLDAALETLSLRIERRYGLNVTLDLPRRAAIVPAHLALAVYRIAQEALHNAGQHAGAGRVGLSLRLEQNSLRLTIADDGDGFQPPEPPGVSAGGDKWGLAEMVRQAESAGGRLEISSVLGVGTQVRALLQLAPPEPSWPAAASAEESLVELLTSRERDVLAGVAAGLTNKQIAARLGISDRTVQFHLGNVLSKLGVASRTEAAVWALQRGLV